MRSALALSFILATLTFGSYEASALDLGGGSDSRSDSRSDRRSSGSRGGLSDIGRGASSAIRGTRRAASSLVGSARNTIGSVAGSLDRASPNQTTILPPRGSVPMATEAESTAAGLPLPRARPVAPAVSAVTAPSLMEPVEAPVDLGRSADLSRDAVADQWIVETVASGTPEPILANSSFASEREVALSRSVPTMHDRSAVREIPGFPFQAPAPVELARAIPGSEVRDEPDPKPLLRTAAPVQQEEGGVSQWRFPLVPMALAGLVLAVAANSTRLRESIAARFQLRAMPAS